MAAIAAPQPSTAVTWTTLIRAMGASAGGAAVSGALSVVATKIIAVQMGPASLAVLATLQQVRQMTLVAGTANGQTALVQGASFNHGLERREYLRTVALIFAAATLVAAAALALAPGAIAHWAGLPARHATMLRGLAIAVALSSVFVFLSALLNALRAIGSLAILQIAGPAAMAALAWPVARGILGFPLMLTLAAAVTVASAACALVRHRATLSHWFSGTGEWFSGVACRHFFSISTAMLVTGLIGSAALVTVRAKILRGQGLVTAGQFDAAWNVSMNYVSLVLASLQAYYLPTLARLRTRQERSAQIARVLTIAAPVTAGAIAALAIWRPLLFSLLYSPAFLDAGRYLRWTLLGDYLKVASWILSVPMLAAADMKMFLASDLAAWGTFLAAAAILARWKSPAESGAMAFALMHVVHLGMGAAYVHRRHAFRWHGPTLVVWLAGLAVVGSVSLLRWNP